jgi:hypothetical protein
MVVKLPFSYFFIKMKKKYDINLGAIFCYIATQMTELEQEITLTGDSGDPQITIWVSNDDYLHFRRGKILL